MSPCRDPEPWDITGGVAKGKWEDLVHFLQRQQWTLGGEKDGAWWSIILISLGCVGDRGLLPQTRLRSPLKRSILLGQLLSSTLVELHNPVKAAPNSSLVYLEHGKRGEGLQKTPSSATTLFCWHISFERHKAHQLDWGPDRAKL